MGRWIVDLDESVLTRGHVRDGARCGTTAAVTCDLGTLPFRRGALSGVVAGDDLAGIASHQLPLALARLHRALRVGGTLTAALPDPVGHAPLAPEVALRDLLVGAGFAVDVIGGAERAPGVSPHRDVRVRRVRTLPDTVGPGMRLLVCGLNPSLYAADAGVGFARPGNRFWPAALAAGLVSVDRDPDHALCRHGIGMTDLVKRATAAAAELRVAEYRTGVARVERLVAWLRPAAVCVVGLAGWRAAVDPVAGPGVQRRELGGSPVYVMPSTSGLNARTTPAEHARHLHRASALADGRREL